MSASSLTKPEQFVVVDDYTVQSISRRKTADDSDLAVIVPAGREFRASQEECQRRNLGLEFAKQQTVGSGAEVTKWTAGAEVILERNDGWVGIGPAPKIRQVIWRMAAGGNRRAANAAMPMCRMICPTSFVS
jgi:peptide/nickel transport system substrate-binding protein